MSSLVAQLLGALFGLSASAPLSLLVVSLFNRAEMRAHRREAVRLFDLEVARIEASRRWKEMQ